MRLKTVGAESGRRGRHLKVAEIISAPEAETNSEQDPRTLFTPKDKERCRGVIEQEWRGFDRLVLLFKYITTFPEEALEITEMVRRTREQLEVEGYVLTENSLPALYSKTVFHFPDGDISAEGFLKSESIESLEAFAAVAIFRSDEQQWNDTKWEQKAKAAVERFRARKVSSSWDQMAWARIGHPEFDSLAQLTPEEKREMYVVLNKTLNYERTNPDRARFKDVGARSIEMIFSLTIIAADRVVWKEDHLEPQFIKAFLTPPALPLRSEI